MTIRKRLLALSVAAVAIAGGASLAAARPQTDETPLRTLDPELLEARTLFLWATPFATELRERLVEELDDWSRFDDAESREEADVMVLLEAEYDFATVPLESGACDDAESESEVAEPELRKRDPLCGRPLVTELATSAFLMTILVEGEGNLWKDEVTSDSEVEAAKILVERLRAALEAAEEAASSEAAPDSR